MQCVTSSHRHLYELLPVAGRSSDNEKIGVGCRFDLQRLEVKGALSDRAVASALSLADLPWLPKLPDMPKAHRPQPSERLLKLLQATGAQHTLSVLSRFPANTATVPSVE